MNAWQVITLVVTFLTGALGAIVRWMLKELSEQRKTITRQAELLARQDERDRIEMAPRSRPRPTRPPHYVTETPPHGVPVHVEPEESNPHWRGKK